MSPLDFHPEANDAVDYYDGQRAGPGDDFRAELDAALSRIQQNPKLYAVAAGALRLCHSTASPIPSCTKSWRIASGWRQSPTRAAAPATGRGADRTDPIRYRVQLLRLG